MSINQNNLNINTLMEGKSESEEMIKKDNLKEILKTLSNKYFKNSNFSIDDSKGKKEDNKIDINQKYETVGLKRFQWDRFIFDSFHNIWYNYRQNPLYIEIRNTDFIKINENGSIFWKIYSKDNKNSVILRDFWNKLNLRISNSLIILDKNFKSSLKEDFEKNLILKTRANTNFTKELEQGKAYNIIIKLKNAWKVEDKTQGKLIKLKKMVKKKETEITKWLAPHIGGIIVELMKVEEINLINNIKEI